MDQYEKWDYPYKIQRWIIGPTVGVSEVKMENMKSIFFNKSTVEILGWIDFSEHRKVSS